MSTASKYPELVAFTTSNEVPLCPPLAFPAILPKQSALSTEILLLLAPCTLAHIVPPLLGPNLTLHKTTTNTNNTTRRRRRSPPPLLDRGLFPCPRWSSVTCHCVLDWCWLPLVTSSSSRGTRLMRLSSLVGCCRLTTPVHLAL